MGKMNGSNGKQKKSERVRVARTSADLLAEQVEKLKELFPEATSEGKVDFDKLKTTLGEFADDRPERYSFTWAGKRDCIKLLQVPSRATLIPCPDESIDWETTSNVFIEGENLEVLKLLYKAYYGRVKMIYIDPPYNTGKDFIYPDNFADPLDTYLRLTGQKDSEGNVLTSNPETSGRYHSAWLSMIYPRLFVARQLLRDDGVIFVSIDDNEVYNLRIVMNEIFGEECFVADIVVVNNLKGRNDRKHIATAHERLLMYVREAFSEYGLQLTPERLAEYRYEDKRGKYRPLGLRKRGGADTRAKRPNLFFPLYVDPKTKAVSLEPKHGYAMVLPVKSDGTDGCWRWNARKVARRLVDLIGERVGTTERYDVFVKDRLEVDGKQRRMKPKSVWFGSDVSTDGATKAFRRLMPGVEFKNPKPVAFLDDLVTYATEDDDIVLDFFAGSATTAHAVLAVNSRTVGSRQFIVAQLPESMEAPLKQVKTIADIGKERIRRVIAKMKKEKAGKFATDGPQDLGFRVYKLAESNYKAWKGTDEKDPEKYAKTMEMFLDPLKDGWRPEDVIAEVALKEAGFGLNCRIEQIHHQDTKAPSKKNGGPTIFKVSDPDKEQFFYICLDDKVRLDDLKPLNLTRDMLLVCRDVSLDDETAANLALQCRLRTI